MEECEKEEGLDEKKNEIIERFLKIQLNHSIGLPFYLLKKDNVQFQITHPHMKNCTKRVLNLWI